MVVELGAAVAGGEGRAACWCAGALNAALKVGRGSGAGREGTGIGVVWAVHGQGMGATGGGRRT
jgi:hypothetical protein